MWARGLIAFVGFVVFAADSHAAEAGRTALPNIVFILADDLGYGDLGCYNPESKIPTPNIDRLATEGMRFTDMHSGSAVCTPTRYGLLTGRYSWRSSLARGVLNGYSTPIIPPARATVASLLKAKGYKTAICGKWHLGLDWAKRGVTIDYAAPVQAGPLALGFDRFFGIPASLDMPPYLYVRDDHAVDAPTETIGDSPKPMYWRGGPIAPGFNHAEVQGKFTWDAIETIEQHAATANGAPLFLYLPYASPHTPVLPLESSHVRSGAGAYGEFVCGLDDDVGRILDTLDRLGMKDNTAVIFSSDNGFAPAGGLDAVRALGHEPCPGLRGHKADIFEGGHRVPFIVRWPGHIAPRSVSGRTAWLGDFFATAAAIADVSLPENAAEDSVSLLPVLHGEDAPPRGPVVHHSADGFFAIRDDKWKLIFCSHSGGWSAPKPDEAAAQGLASLQLYDLSTDLAEQHNVAGENPEIVARLTDSMREIVETGRSTPGPARGNDRAVEWPR